MGRSWDKVDGGWHLMWLREALRVLVPGGVAKVFGATRTFHRLAQAMEQVGFILDPRESMEVWAYASGFPKSLNIAKKIDERAGIDTSDPNWGPVTPEAKLWSGYGTALKPAFEPFLVGRKPK